jgi:hypothetical protein
MPHLPTPFSKVEWWKEPRPQVLDDIDEDPVLPLSEVVFRMKVFLYDYSKAQDSDAYRRVARIIGGGTARELFRKIVKKGLMGPPSTAQLDLFGE